MLRAEGAQDHASSQTSQAAVFERLLNFARRPILATCIAALVCLRVFVVPTFLQFSGRVQYARLTQNAARSTRARFIALSGNISNDAVARPA